jgi:hypothetical protein
MSSWPEPFPGHTVSLLELVQIPEMLNGSVELLRARKSHIACFPFVGWRAVE